MEDEIKTTRPVNEGDTLYAVSADPNGDLILGKGVVTKRATKRIVVAPRSAGFAVGGYVYLDSDEPDNLLVTCNGYTSMWQRTVEDAKERLRREAADSRRRAQAQLHLANTILANLDKLDKLEG
jgi:hypothetical protein